MSNLPPRRDPGFTLIELLIVVVILAILASIVVVQFNASTDEASRTSFISSGRIFSDAARRYHLETGVHLEDASSGVMPVGFDPYVQETRWGQTPIGGVWDTELATGGLVASLGVHFNGTGETRDDAYMGEIDSAIDDGDLNTGSFRKIADGRYYFVVAE